MYIIKFNENLKPWPNIIDTVVQSDNLFTQIRFEGLPDIPDSIRYLHFKTVDDNGGTYILEGDIFSVPIGMTQIAGNLECYITISQGVEGTDIVAHTQPFTLKVCRRSDATCEITPEYPTGGDEFLSLCQTARGEAVSAAERAEYAAERAEEIVESGGGATHTYVDTQDAATFESAKQYADEQVPSVVQAYVSAHRDYLKGERGEKGDQGERGFQGIQGVAGEKGDKGDNGIDGTNGADGISVIGTLINEEHHLIVTLSNNTTIDSGYCRGEQGERGLQGVQGEQGLQGIQGEQGVQGEQGESGVGTFELIDCVNVTEEVHQLRISATPTNVPYNFSCLYVKCVFPLGGGDINIYIDARFDTQYISSSNFTNAIRAQYQRTCGVRVENNGGVWFSTMYMPAGDASSFNIYYPSTLTAPTTVYDCPCINEIVVRCSGASNMFPVGSKIYIYGVWNNENI